MDRAIVRWGLAVIVLAGLARETRGQPPRPNVLLIISDDQAWTDFGFMGHPEIRTPRIDGLARESLQYRRGHVTASLCCPSLATILTGLYPHQSRITGNEPPLPPGVPAARRYQNPRFQREVERFVALFELQPRLPAELGRLGYRSLQTGKWWGGSYTTGGFTAGMSHGDPLRGGRHGDAGLEIGRQTLEPITRFVDEAHAAGQPFLVWYAPMLPHDPHNPPERLLAHYRTRTPSIHLARYWAMCEWLDETVGTLLDHLDRTGLADDTIVVFVVDNGRVQDPEGPGALVSKNSPYEAGLRTPILVRWPGRITPRIDDTPVSTIDLAPTLYRAVGAPVPPGLPGIDLLDRAAVTARPAIFGACFLHTARDLDQPGRNLTYRWAIADDWKLIVPGPARVDSPYRGPENPSMELFNLGEDPGEARNLADAEQARAAELGQLMDAWWRP
jgi:uncharacterized sulfatase